MANSKYIIPGPSVIPSANLTGSPTTSVPITSNAGSLTMSDPFIYVNGGIGYDNGYADLAAGGYQNSAYYKDAFGIVHLVIGCKSGSAGFGMFTLPAGYRPAGNVLAQIYVDTGAINFVKVQTNGIVLCLLGGGTSQAIGLIQFPGVN